VDVIVAPSWRAQHAGARVGVLVLRGVDNPAQHAGLDARARAVEASLRERFAGATRATLRELPAIRAYDAFYRRFEKSYHVLAQLESVAVRGKPLGAGSVLVQAMFMAEVATQLLTAGHDLAAVEPPVTIVAAEGGETYTRINGTPQELKRGDMCTVDARGVLSSVIYGPDQRTRLGSTTRDAMFVTYAPVGIDDGVLRGHLEAIEDHVRVVSPGAVRETLDVHGGG
jgi:DNA/RNA-binding domain of Phe-tRNA-synthetase-like protein